MKFYKCSIKSEKAENDKKKIRSIENSYEYGR